MIQLNTPLCLKKVTNKCFVLINGTRNAFRNNKSGPIIIKHIGSILTSPGRIAISLRNAENVPLLKNSILRNQKMEHGKLFALFDQLTIDTGRSERDPLLHTSNHKPKVLLDFRFRFGMQNSRSKKFRATFCPFR